MVGRTAILVRFLYHEYVELLLGAVVADLGFHSLVCLGFSLLYFYRYNLMVLLFVIFDLKICILCA